MFRKLEIPKFCNQDKIGQAPKQSVTLKQDAFVFARMEISEILVFTTCSVVYAKRQFSSELFVSCTQNRYLGKGVELAGARLGIRQSLIHSAGGILRIPESSNWHSRAHEMTPLVEKCRAVYADPLLLTSC